VASERWALKVLDYAEQDLAELPSRLKVQAMEIILDLQTDPFPADSILLRGWNDVYRIRLEGYRIVYRVNKRRRAIMVERVKPRSVAYLGLD
jgi:mRNA interferase RelE/StbE